MTLQEKYNFQDQTVLLAIEYMDNYLLHTLNAKIEIYQLVGIVALMLAVKMQEDVVLTQEQANMECKFLYSVQMMQMVELDMIKKLSYNLNLPTSLDILLQLLYLDDEGQLASIDKSLHIQNLVSQALPIIYLCFNEYEVVHQHTQLTIALASIFWILNKSDINNPIRASSEILLNYIMFKLRSVFQEHPSHQFNLLDVLHNTN